jgi:hypothetical protein
MESKRVDSLLVDFIAFLQVLIAFAVVVLSQDVPIPDDIIREIVVQTIDDHNLPPFTEKRRHRRIVSPSYSNPPKRACIQNDYKRSEESVFSDWAGPVPRFPDKQFERTFRIKQSMVDIILNHLASTNRFWTKTVCRAGKETICPYVKLLCALKMICYGVSMHAFLDYHQFGETTSRRCVHHLVRGLVSGMTNQ